MGRIRTIGITFAMLTALVPSVSSGSPTSCPDLVADPATQFGPPQPGRYPFDFGDSHGYKTVRDVAVRDGDWTFFSVDDENSGIGFDYWLKTAEPFPFVDGLLLGGLQVPLRPNQPISRASADALYANPVVSFPVGESSFSVPTYRPNPTSATALFTSTTQLGDLEILNVQGCRAQTWPVYWDVRVTTPDPFVVPHSFRLSGVFWLWADGGGWPIKEEFLLDGDAVRGGAFTAAITSLIPAA